MRELDPLMRRMERCWKRHLATFFSFPPALARLCPSLITVPAVESFIPSRTLKAVVLKAMTPRTSATSQHGGAAERRQAPLHPSTSPACRLDTIIMLGAARQEREHDIRVTPSLARKVGKLLSQGGHVCSGGSAAQIIAHVVVHGHCLPSRGAPYASTWICSSRTLSAKRIFFHSCIQNGHKETYLQKKLIWNSDVCRGPHKIWYLNGPRKTNSFCENCKIRTITRISKIKNSRCLPLLCVVECYLDRLAGRGPWEMISCRNTSEELHATCAYSFCIKNKVRRLYGKTTY